MDLIKTITTPIEKEIHIFNSIRYTQSRIRHFDEKRNEFIRNNNIPELQS